MNPKPANDQADLLQLQRGHEAALGRLMARWERRLFAFAWRYLQNAADARELVVETFVRLHQQRLRLRPDTNLPAWLFTTLQNLCRNQHRWRRRHPTTSLDDAKAEHSDTGDGWLLSTAPEDAPDMTAEHDEDLAALAVAIDQLPHDLKGALLLYYYDGLSYREVGEITGCSERCVETRLYRARQRLREKLAAQLSEMTAEV